MEYPQINMVETGRNIRRLRKARGITIRELQEFFGFDSPRAIYKWQKGETLPSVDNLFALGVILNAPLESILSARKPIEKEQQTNVCCSFPSQLYFPVGCLRCARDYLSFCHLCSGTLAHRAKMRSILEGHPHKRMQRK